MPEPFSFHRRAALGAAMGVGVAAIPACATTGTGPLGDLISVRELGAKGDGVSDDTLAVQRAIDLAANCPDGGTVWFPPGRYAVITLSAGNRDPASFHPTLRLLGAGPAISSIVPLRTGRVLLDAAGRSGLHIEGLSIDSNHLLSRAGLLLARTASSPNCNGTHIRELVVEGAFSSAAVVSVAAESSVWTACRLQNGHRPANSACLITGASPALMGFADDSRLVTGPNTDNKFFGCAFHAPYPAARPVQFRGAAAAMFFGCTIIAGDASNVRLASYLPDNGIFNGPVGWVGCHFEVFGSNNVVHFLDTPPGVSYFESLQCDGGTLVISPGTAQVDFERRTATHRPVLRNWSWRSPAVQSGADTIDMHAYLVDGCRIDARVGPDVGDLVALGAIRNSDAAAAEIRTPQVVGRALRLGSAGVPREGTWPAGALIDNLRVAVGEPAGWRVALGCGGTFATKRAGTLQVGAIVELNGAAHVVWQVDADGRVLLDGMDSPLANSTPPQARAPVLLALPSL